MDNRNDRLVLHRTGRYVGRNETRGGCGIGLRAQVSEASKHLVARRTGLLRFGPLVSALEVLGGPPGYEAGGQTGIDLLEMVFDGHYHRGKRVVLCDGKATALEQDARISSVAR